MMRGGGYSCEEVKTCCSGSSLDWAVSLIDPSLLLWSLSDLLEFSGVSPPDLDLDLSVPELSLRLILGVGSLTGSKHNLSKGILVNLLSLYILNSWNSAGGNHIWAECRTSLSVLFYWNISSKRSSSLENTFVLTAVVKLLTISKGSNSVLGNLNNHRHNMLFTSLNS